MSDDKPETPANESIDAAICTGALVATIVIEWPRDSGEKRAVLLFSFSTHDNNILPPVVYVGDDLDDVAALVSHAVANAHDVDLDSVELPTSS